jgi:Flp pilus assembly protein TadD
MSPASTDIYLAEQQMALGNSRGAIEALRRAMAADPDNAIVHAYLALCLHDIKQYAPARQAVDAALKLEPGSGFVRYVAGTILLHQNRFADAEAHLTEAQRLAPWDARPVRQLAHLYDETRRKQEVLPTLTRALSLAPEDPEIVSAIGAHHLEAGDLAAAEIHAHDALRIDPEHLAANLLMGHLKFRRGDVEGARDHALIALNRDARHEPALHLLCLIKTRKNPFVGLWWHFSVRADRIGTRWWLAGLAAVFAMFFVFAQFLDGEDADKASRLLILIFLLAGWGMAAGQSFFHKALKKEIASVQLRDF